MKAYLKSGFLTTLLALSMSAPVLASNHGGDCNCTKECQESCKKGEGKDCTCEHCDCKKSGDCGESCARKKK